MDSTKESNILPIEQERVALDEAGKKFQELIKLLPGYGKAFNPNDIDRLYRLLIITSNQGDIINRQPGVSDSDYKTTVRNFSLLFKPEMIKIYTVAQPKCCGEKLDSYNVLQKKFKEAKIWENIHNKIVNITANFSDETRKLDNNSYRATIDYINVVTEANIFYDKIYSDIIDYTTKYINVKSKSVEPTPEENIAIKLKRELKELLEEKDKEILNYKWITEQLTKYNSDNNRLQHFFTRQSIDTNPSIYTPLDVEYYSSYLDIDRDSFILKDIIWITSQKDQALLHIFDTSSETRLKSIQKLRIQPKIYKFRLNDTIRLIKGKSSDNTKIFNNILDPELIAILKTKIPNYNIQNNKYILYILKVFNSLVNTPYKIDGYYNYFDQNEIGLVNFTEIVRKDSIMESEYRTATIKNYLVVGDTDTMVFPILKTEFKPIKLYNITNEIYRMIPLNPVEIEIKYTVFDEPTNPNLLKWNSLTTNFYELKYLKYKQKYLQLKNQL